MTCRLDRREALLGAAALVTGGGLSGCSGQAAEPTSPPPLPPLKSALPWPLGCAVTNSHLAEPDYVALLTGNFSQITAEFEMKMEAILANDGSFDFTRADQIAAFARDHDLRLHAHTLVWYLQAHPSFQALKGDPAAFARTYDAYVRTVTARYAGQAVGWDVVNEAVAEDGDGYRDCLWRQQLGMDYVARAFRVARAADPNAVLFLNDYNLEAFPNKRATFLKLAEDLLKAGVPLTGLGSQSHLQVDLAPGAIRQSIKDLASLGLPIHISELDISVRPLRKLDFTPHADRVERQKQLLGELRDAFAALPEKQRYALTAWGLRDSDSWLLRPQAGEDVGEEPLLFDDRGDAKALAAVVVGREGVQVAALRRI